MGLERREQPLQLREANWKRDEPSNATEDRQALLQWTSRVRGDV